MTFGKTDRLAILVLASRLGLARDLLLLRLHHRLLGLAIDHLDLIVRRGIASMDMEVIIAATIVVTAAIVAAATGLAVATMAACNGGLVMVLEVARVLASVGLFLVLVARIHAALLVRVLARTMDLAILLVRTIMLGLAFAAVIAAFTLVFAAAAVIAPAAAAVVATFARSTLIAATTVVSVGLARGTVIVTSVPATVVAPAIGCIATEWLLGSAVAVVPSIAVRLLLLHPLDGAVIDVALMLQTHELGDLFHCRALKLLASLEVSIPMLLAIGAEVPFLDFFFGR